MTSPERTSWWQTLPGVLTGVAAIITAIGALIGALHLIGVFEGDDPPGPPPGTAAPGGRPAADAPAPPTAGPPTASAVPSLPGAAGQGLLTMTGIVSADLELGVVGFGVPGQDFLVLPAETQFSLTGSTMGSYLSPVEGQPRKDVCTSALTTNRLTDLKLDAESVGRWWCVRTQLGNTGAIQVKSVSFDAPRELVLGYVLWR